MTEYKYLLTIGPLTVQTSPVNTFGSKIEYEQTEDNRFAYVPKFSNKIVFKNKDFDFIYQHETSGSRCQYAYFEIQEKCGSGFNTVQRFRISMSKCGFDIGRCEVTANLDIITNYDCYDDNKEIEIDLFTKITNLKVANFTRGTIQLVNYTTPNKKDFYVASQFPEPNPQANGWVLYKYTGTGPVVLPNGSQAGPYNYFYAREVISPGVYRTPLLSKRIPLGVDTATRPAGRPEDNPNALFEYSIIGQAGFDSMDNGFLLADVLNQFANDYCQKPVKSIFFQIGTTDPFLTTYPNLPGNTFHNLLFQKSDVKRPYDFNNATKAVCSWKQIIDGICSLYNLQYIIDDTNFIIEHVSYFNRTVGIDTTAHRYSEFKQSLKYSYASEKLPQREEFKTMEAKNKDFVGLPILYNNACASKEVKKTIDAGFITTDVQFCFDAGVRDEDGNDSGLVSDDGFVLVACELVGNNYYILREPGILDTKEKLNNPLAWAQLHRDYWKYDRPLKQGEMNGQQVVFNTAKPIQKGEKIVIPFCYCTDVIRLTDLVKTKLGNGAINTASYNIFNKTLEITPVYEQKTLISLCLPVSSFTFVSRLGDVFTFNTTFQQPGPLTIETQQSFNGGPWVTVANRSENAGNSTITIANAPIGEHRFRKRVVCGAENSEFSAIVTHVIYTTVCNGTPIAEYVRYNSQFRAFTFRTLRTNATNPVETEITRPDSEVFFADDSSATVDATYRYWSVPIDRPPLQPGQTSGQYKFRFRFNCAPNVYGVFSSQITVNL